MKIELLKALVQIRLDEVACNGCEEKRRNRVAGQAFTSYTCKGCKKQDMHHNTATPNYCKDCAIRTLSCQRCMNKLKDDYPDERI